MLKYANYFICRLPSFRNTKFILNLYFLFILLIIYISTQFAIGFMLLKPLGEITPSVNLLL